MMDVRVIIWFIFYMRLTFVFEFWKILDCVVVPIVLVTVMGNNMAGNKRCFERQHLNMLQMHQPNEVYLLFQKLMKMNIFWHVSSQRQLEDSSIIVRQFLFQYHLMNNKSALSKKFITMELNKMVSLHFTHNCI